MEKLKYDFYRSRVDGAEEVKLSQVKVNIYFNHQDLVDMSEGKEISFDGKWKFWAEEAINYSEGIEIPNSW